MKRFNVFYTLVSPEQEIVVKAESLEEAVKKVVEALKFLGHVDAEVRAGWVVDG